MLSTEQKATNADTYEHIDQFMRLMGHAQVEIMRRQYGHDRSKLCSPEVEVLTKHRGDKEAMGPALKHHYESNRHHPEHYPSGIEGMNLFDVLEMVVDWYADTKKDGGEDIYDYIEANRDRFSIEPQLLTIIRNTIPWLVGSMFEPSTRPQNDMQPIESSCLICKP